MLKGRSFSIAPTLEQQGGGLEVPHEPTVVSSDMGRTPSQGALPRVHYNGERTPLHFSGLIILLITFQVFYTPLRPPRNLWKIPSFLSCPPPNHHPRQEVAIDMRPKSCTSLEKQRAELLKAEGFS
jgi:hypothetical protein